MSDQVVFVSDTGQALTVGDLDKPVEGLPSWRVLVEAQRLHQEGRAAGSKNELARALECFEQAYNLSPEWPYPRYDAAFTVLLLDDPVRAAQLYEEVDRLCPGGFYTCKTTLAMLRRELAGEFFPGFAKAFMQLEWITDADHKAGMLAGIVEKYPDFAPGWKELAALLRDPEQRLYALYRGLKADPDPETKGMLAANLGLALAQRGERDAAVRVLAELILDPNRSMAGELHAKNALKQVLGIGGTPDAS
ncbi:tetratricopeptide repeat protein [Yinghuangia soli]|uniref:Tetratricopeptide repeat protein n=1 Tax=Yinghuangia soli TaxID=2908204 RepID=A0AA41U4X5_9ACTN|nr:hypothetical protein [Yinghuangia soli]MCF2533400.1 hypothetical protein [Yinghuangia soli]